MSKHIEKYRPRNLTAAVAAFLAVLVAGVANAVPASAQATSALDEVKDEMSSQIGDVKTLALYGVGLVLALVVIGALTGVAARWIRKGASKA